MKKGIIVGIVILMIIGFLSLGGCSSSGARGDGITTCKNCGRKGVVLFGYCENCANSFLKWQRDNGY